MNIIISFFYLVIVLTLLINIHKRYKYRYYFNRIEANKTVTDLYSYSYINYYTTLPSIIEFNILRDISYSYNAKVVIAVISSPNNIKKRFSFRKLSRRYCNINFDCMFVFFIGYSFSENDNILKRESVEYNDVVQFSFINSYFNLTILSIMALKYCFRYYSKLQYYIKTDDDIVINYSTLFNTINRINVWNNNIYGHYNGKFKVNRNNKSRLYIPFSEYKYKYCPEYAYGGLIIITCTSLAKLYNLTLYKQNYIWKEDVNLGVLCKKCNISVTQFPNKVDLHIKRKECKKYNKIIATEIYNRYDNFYCMNLYEK